MSGKERTSMNLAKPCQKGPDLLVAYANIGAGIMIRIFGAIPGPILLAYFVDSNAIGSMPGAYVVIGVIGSVLSTIAAGIAVAKGPEKDDPFLDDSFMEAGK